MTENKKQWLDKMSALVRLKDFDALDAELLDASRDYISLTKSLIDATDRLRVATDDLDSRMMELQALLNDVAEKGDVVELCDAIRGDLTIENVPEHRRKLIVWPHAQMWMLSITAQAVLDHSQNVQARVVLEDSILPSGATMDLMEIQIKMKNEIWEIHKNDADKQPSNPHAHLGARTKLDLRNGDLYNKATFTNKRISKKHLIALRAAFEAKGLEMPVLDLSTSKMTA